VVAVAIAAAAIGATTFVYAGENGFGFGGPMGPGGENHDEMIAAMESGDYDTWKDLVTSRAEEFASEDNFNNMKQVHDLMAEGKVEEADALREELGMPGHKGHGMPEEMKAVREAVANNDYEAWKTAMEESVVNRLDELEGKINEGTFNKLVEAHQAMESGDMDKAKEIRDELGFPGGPGRHRGGGMGRGMSDSE